MTIYTAHRVSAPRVLKRRRRAAGDWIRGAGSDDLREGFAIGKPAESLEPLEDISTPQSSVRWNHGRVALEARTWLWPLRDTLGVLLVLEHVRVAATVAIVDGERVACEHARQPGKRRGFLAGSDSDPPNRVFVGSAVRR